MGFSNIFAAALAFSVLLGIFYVLYESLPKEVVELDSELTEKYDDLASRAATDFSLINMTHFSDSNITTMILENDGRSTLNPSMLSFILDGSYLDETFVDINRTVFNDNVNPNLWDPGEVLVCNLTCQLDLGVHIFKAFYSNGVWCTGRIRILNNSIPWIVLFTDPVEGSTDAGADIISFGAGNDSESLYLRINLSASISDDCIYSWYIDVDSNGSTGVLTNGGRTLVEYPSNTTQVYGSGAGIEYLVSYREGSPKLYSQGDLSGMLEEKKELEFSNPSGSSLLIRVPLADLGFEESDDPSLSFYIYGVDSIMRTDFAPDS